jgi:hypothetical protein
MEIGVGTLVARNEGIDATVAQSKVLIASNSG